MRLLFLLLIICVTSAIAEIYHMPKPGDDVVGQIFTIQVRKGDTIHSIRHKYDISYHELLEANPGISPRNLRASSKIIIPAQHILPKYRRGIVINIAALRLYYFTKDGKYVFTTPVGLGRSGWRTPTFSTIVTKKKENPTWHVPKSILEYNQSKGRKLAEKIPPGPDNPLGKYAIYLARRGYLLHGNNDPDSVGVFFSSGCIRLSNAAIKFLFTQVAIRTPVKIIHHNVKAGWLDRKLYLEVQQPVNHDEELSELNYTTVKQTIAAATANRSANIDFKQLSMVEKQQTGIPTVIGQQLME